MLTYVRACLAVLLLGFGIASMGRAPQLKAYFWADNEPVQPPANGAENEKKEEEKEKKEEDEGKKDSEDEEDSEDDDSDNDNSLDLIF